MKRLFFSRIVILFLLLIPAHIVSGQHCEEPQRYGWFIPVWFAKPLVSEMEGPMTKVAEGFGRAREEYAPSDKHSDKYVPYLNVSLGVFLPVWSKQLRNNWAIGIDFPISFHLWLDLKAQSAPVLNTDYRFAVGEIKVLKKFPNNKYLHNLSMRLAPYCHESTHIGDELTILREQAGFPLTRVNVSYEYSEFAICLNDPNGTRKDNHALKLGIMLRNPTTKSWFKIYPNEGDSIYNHKMKNIPEFYGEYEWQRSTGWATNKNILNVLSVELRNRAQYKYPSIKWDEGLQMWYAAPVHHSRAWCVNLYYGWKFMPTPNWYYNSVGFYLNAYHGIVPYGQFRNTGGYSYLGFSIVVEQ
ncbi:MAG: DUF1207 domain-containing protein [Bacteroidales bacterium]